MSFNTSPVYMTKENFVNNLRTVIKSWAKDGKHSYECKKNVSEIMHGWQCMLPVTSQHDFYTEERFQEVMNVLQDPNSALDSLDTIYLILFPKQVQGFTLYFTPMQVETLVEVLFPLTLHIVIAREVVQVDTRPAPVAAVSAVVEEEMTMPVAKKLMTKAIDMCLTGIDKKIVNNDPRDAQQVLNLVAQMEEFDELRESMVATRPITPEGFDFMVNPDDVQFDHDLERALRMSMSDY